MAQHENHKSAAKGKKKPKVKKKMPMMSKKEMQGTMQPEKMDSMMIGGLPKPPKKRKPKAKKKAKK